MSWWGNEPLVSLTTETINCYTWRLPSAMICLFRLARKLSAALKVPKISKNSWVHITHPFREPHELKQKTNHMCFIGFVSEKQVPMQASRLWGWRLGKSKSHFLVKTQTNTQLHETYVFSRKNKQKKKRPRPSPKSAAERNNLGGTCAKTRPSPP